MKSEKIFNAIGKISDELIEDASIMSKKVQAKVWIRWVAVAACLSLLITGGTIIAPFLTENDPVVNLNPLLITVYARGEDGAIIPTALKVGEKVKLYPATSPYTDNFNGYAFDLTLLEAKYVRPTAVTEDWEPKLYPGYDYWYTEDDFHWSLTEGDDIYVVAEDKNGNAVPIDLEKGPSPHGSAVIWRPNDDGLSRNIISVYGDDCKLMARYYLEITEMNGDYYAEVVKIVYE